MKSSGTGRIKKVFGESSFPLEVFLLALTVIEEFLKDKPFLDLQSQKLNVFKSIRLT